MGANRAPPTTTTTTIGLVIVVAAAAAVVVVIVSIIILIFYSTPTTGSGREDPHLRCGDPKSRFASGGNRRPVPDVHYCNYDCNYCCNYCKLQMEKAGHNWNRIDV